MVETCSVSAADGTPNLREPLRDTPAQYRRQVAVILRVVVPIAGKQVEYGTPVLLHYLVRVSGQRPGDT
jgi:hypothetical protein